MHAIKKPQVLLDSLVDVIVEAHIERKRLLSKLNQDKRGRKHVLSNQRLEVVHILLVCVRLHKADEAEECNCEEYEKSNVDQHGSDYSPALEVLFQELDAHDEWAQYCTYPNHEYSHQFFLSSVGCI
jgi:hypothetical protein